MGMYNPSAGDSLRCGGAIGAGGARRFPLACGGVELCLYRCGVPLLWRGARFLFPGTRAGREEETSSRKYEPVRYWSGAHVEPRGWQLASYWGSALHIARYAKPGKSLDATTRDLEW